MTPTQLKKLMKKYKLTQAHIAAELGYNKSTISRYVNGKTNIPDKFIISVHLMVATCNIRV